MATAVRPIPIKFHKKKAQFQFEVHGPYRSDANGRLRHGNILIEAARSLNAEGTEMDWEHKLNFALGLPDIAKLLAGLRFKEEQVRLVHDNNGLVKTLSLTAGRDHSYAIALQYTKKSENVSDKISVFLSRDDMVLLVEIIRTCLPHLLGVNSGGSYA